MTPSTLDRIRGTIFGGALGDTVGLFTEFLNVQQALEYYGPNPRFSLTTPAPEGFKACYQGTSTSIYRHRAMFEPAAWTDDTDQALLILLSFLRSGGQGVDPLDFAARIRVWIEGGLRALDRLPLGVGSTVGGVVRSEGYIHDPIGIARSIWERTGKRGAANGAVMRTGILGCLLFLDQGAQGGIERTMKTAISVAQTTHADPRCLISCAIVSGAIAAIMRGELKEETDLGPVVEQAKQLALIHDPPISQEHLSELDALLATSSLADLHLDERSTIGYTYKCLVSGIWALKQAIQSTAQGKEDPSIAFERIITDLTMAAGDADTNAAVAGPLIGCYLSSSALPVHWLSELKHADWLKDKCDAAFLLLALSDSSLTPTFGNPPSIWTAEGSKPASMSESTSSSPAGTFPVLELTSFVPPRPTYTPSNPYSYLSDDDTLVDAGKGPMTKEMLDAKWKVLIEDMHIRLGDLPPGGLAAMNGGNANKNGCTIQ